MFERLKISPGLLTLRYAAPPEGVADAVIRPFVPPESRGAVSLMFEPGNVAGALVRPGQLCVIRCSRPAILGLEIVARNGGDRPNGGMELEYLTHAEGEIEEPAGTSDLVVCFDHFGDRPVRFGDWAAGKAANQPISGLMIRARALSTRVMLRDPVSDQTAAPGEFLGSRTGFRPLSELQLWIAEPDGRDRLYVQADFARAGRVEARGTLVTLHGAGPDDRILRLNIGIEAVRPAQPAPGTEPARPEKVRIFRKD